MLKSFGYADSNTYLLRSKTSKGKSRLDNNEVWELEKLQRTLQIPLAPEQNCFKAF